MRILYVSHSFPLPGDPLSNVGGMQRVAQGLHAALGEHPGVELHSLLLETSWKGTPYRMPGYMAGLLARVPRMVRDLGIDVVLHSSMVTASTTAVLGNAIRRAGAISAAIPVGRDVTLPTPGYQWFVPRVLRSLDVVFPISRATGKECLDRGLPPSRMHVVPCGVDVELFGAPRDRRAARAELLRAIGESGASIPEDALILVSVGRHQERKGFQWFTDTVMPRLPRDVVYLITGEGPMTPRIQEAITRNGVQRNVRMLGKVSESMLTTLYGGADLFVMPNIPVKGDMEGFGVVMLEAGLCGMPVVAADLEGISDVIREGENGHLVPSRDAEAFERVILRYRADRALVAEASRRAAAYTASHFSWSAIADTFVRLLGQHTRTTTGTVPTKLARAAG
ncbi:glycosyltransferase family 4 protein [Longimicrobium terrae]|uniref:Phosphatidylinositol alpha-1,6-mannosyltransferase n=1 Tax=Longimicrobium terrae TaxID=1639882 RepID=A0A841H0Z2_9BACT|nr:glycosyltransferase family 4 protein [Longimicrobium terrae]MBB4637150.1 phosphatidylinositol alpha-1,6-mannosyltransferase [Longimicrobium terrae]MBB6071589.1 phosphatidylinositol alpha-1,6-mannosyltransferase [Longimicrobium terrae]NNC29992.1 glycosyltransferase family 4 protein [Longimicrobium terrae]